MKRMFLVTGMVLVLGLCLSANIQAADVIKVGFDIELTGDIPKVGEASKYAGEMLKEQINRAGGLKVGNKSYHLNFVYEDNEAKAESAAAAALNERRNQMADTLSGGEQQMLSVARAMMTGGRMMLLDEPSMGLAPNLMYELFRVLKEINQQGTTILLVEQNARIALKYAHRGYVLETGNIVLEGNTKELAQNGEVKKAYLGE